MQEDIPFRILRIYDILKRLRDSWITSAGSDIILTMSEKKISVMRPLPVNTLNFPRTRGFLKRHASAGSVILCNTMTAAPRPRVPDQARPGGNAVIMVVIALLREDMKDATPGYRAWLTRKIQ